MGTHNSAYFTGLLCDLNCNTCKELNSTWYILVNTQKRMAISFSNTQCFAVLWTLKATTACLQASCHSMISGLTLLLKLHHVTLPPFTIKVHILFHFFIINNNGYLLLSYTSICTHTHTHTFLYYECMFVYHLTLTAFQKDITQFMEEKTGSES